MLWGGLSGESGINRRDRGIRKFRVIRRVWILRVIRVIWIIQGIWGFRP